MAKKIFDQTVDGLDWKIFGPNNENAGPHNGGGLSFEDLKSMMRMNRVALSMGTRPASYTLGFIEQMMTGMPMVSIGPVFGNDIYPQKTFEQHEILGLNQEYGFWSDSPEALKRYCQLLLDSQDLAQEVGRKGRQRAIELFGKQTISDQWKEFLNKL